MSKTNLYPIDSDDLRSFLEARIFEIELKKAGVPFTQRRI